MPAIRHTLRRSPALRTEEQELEVARVADL